MQAYQNVVQDLLGTALASVTVSVFDHDTEDLSTIYSDDGVTPLANPFTNDANGSYKFYAANGRYDVVLEKDGYSFVDEDTADILLDDPVAPSPGDAVGLYAVRGLIGFNNTSTPLTKYDLSAKQVQLWNPSDDTVIVRSDVSCTIDITLAGPIANGRDQAGVFSGSSWIHLYFIDNGAASVGIASANAPTTGTDLPGGYTSWAYAGAQRLNGSTNFILNRTVGATTYYRLKPQVLGSGTATSETAVDVSAAVPPNALRYAISARYSVTYDALTDEAFNLTFAYVTGDDTEDINFVAQGLGEAHTFSDSCPFIEFPNVNQNFYYFWTLPGGGSPTSDLDVFVGSYTIANGDV